MMNLRILVMQEWNSLPVVFLSYFFPIDVGFLLFTSVV